MSVVLETCAILDLNLNEDDPRFAAVDRALNDETCYVAPITLAELYRRIRDDISTERAEMMYGAAVTGGFLSLFHEDSDPAFIKLLIHARDAGIPYTAAYPTAVAAFLGVELMTNETIFDDLEREGFCRIRRY